MRDIIYREADLSDRRRPVIRYARWGKITVSYRGKSCIYRDAIIWPEGSEEWNWRLSDTHHSPGIQINEIYDLIHEYNCDHIILSQGFENVLKVDPITIEWLDNNSIDYYVLNSLNAIELYNSLTQSNKRVGLLLHSTC